VLDRASPPTLIKHLGVVVALAAENCYLTSCLGLIGPLTTKGHKVGIAFVAPCIWPPVFLGRVEPKTPHAAIAQTRQDVSAHVRLVLFAMNRTIDLAFVHRSSISGLTSALQPRRFTIAPSADGCKRLLGSTCLVASACAENDSATTNEFPK